MITFGAEAQSLAILGFPLAQNATSHARHTEDPTHADADAETTEDNGPTLASRGSHHRPAHIRYAVLDCPHGQPRTLPRHGRIITQSIHPRFTQGPPS
ncbi:hypothetical protein [Streptomyces sp. NPDC059092]|uniref:hypothetical protein n=1 Tax=Streptomyces sp. NPDC059092 TaxID=3346725 RepID=UPI0036A43A51